MARADSVLTALLRLVLFYHARWPAMSPWPGAPKSQQTPAINPPSMRFPFSLNENSTTAEVAAAMKTAFDGLTVHEQAFANLPAQIQSQASAAATAAIQNIVNETVTGVTSFNSQTGAVVYFPNLGQVNDQLGNPLYVTQNADAGKKIIAGDSTPVTITLSPSVNLPWFTIIGNDSGSSVALTAGSGAGFYGLSSIYPGGMAFVFYDGTTFWSEGVAIATDSSLGVVMPDGVTLGVNSSGVLSYIGPPIPNFASNEVPGGAWPNLTLVHAPDPPESLQLFSWISGFGAVLLIQGVDYTLSGTAITGTATYTIGDLYAFYHY